MYCIDKQQSNTYNKGITYKSSITMLEQYGTLTQKGQITIPKEIRKLLGVDKYDSVKIVGNERTKEVTLKKAPDILDMAGTLKIDKKLLKKYPIEKHREYMEKFYGKFEKSRLGL